MSRLIMVSKRLPMTVVADREGTRIELRSTGGAADGLRALHAGGDGVWIGWPGTGPDRDALDRGAVDALCTAHRACPVWLAADDAAHCYDGFANAVLWPLLHDRLERLPLHVEHWDAYVRVNQRFADVIAAHYRRGDRVWIHDHHLMLVPQQLRALRPDARIGFFLHRPFPSPEIFRAAPHASRLLHGLLGADLIGFHTATYARHFTAAADRLPGIRGERDRVVLGRHEVRVGVFPMGVDVARAAALAESPDTGARAAALRAPGVALLIGIDRAGRGEDVARRLAAFETMLHRRPGLRGRVRLVLATLPASLAAPAAPDDGLAADAVRARIDRTFATGSWRPVVRLEGAPTPAELAVLFRAADVMAATPLRDGLGRLAKEFVAARGDEDGVLVLSELAGAAAELTEALRVNPYDVDATAEALARAVAMAPAERRTRMRGLRRRVLAYDLHHWARRFTAALDDAAARRSAAEAPGASLPALVARVRRAAHLVVLLDYDGALVPCATVPSLAAPDDDTRALLAAVAQRRATTVHVTSGRGYETVAEWFGDLPIGLHAERGAWSLLPGDDAWVTQGADASDWQARALPLLQNAALDTPGAVVEAKTVSLAWHYGPADAEWGAWRARALHRELGEALAGVPVEIVHGTHVLEIRERGTDADGWIAPVLQSAPDGTLVLAIAGESADAVFGPLPAEAITIRVGAEASPSWPALAHPDDVRRLLWAIAHAEPAVRALPAAAETPTASC